MSLLTEIRNDELDELIGLLRELREASNKLDIAYCDLTNKGENTLSGSEYEEINDVFITVDEYLGTGR